MGEEGVGVGGIIPRREKDTVGARMVSQSAWAAITKAHRLAAYTTDIDFSVPEVGKFKIKLLADLFPGEDPLLGLQRATFLLCPLVAEGEGSDLLFL